jgi:hypothetical protein
MKVLFANIPTPNNRFMIDLKEALEQFCEVTWDYKEFWECKNQYDIIHIHWPEYLSFDLESYLKTQTPLPSALWDRIKICFEYWSKHSTIIYTRHVQNPHTRNDSEFQYLYKLSASYCKAVVHFAHYSINQFKEYYPNLSNINHFVIPHHNYASLPNDVSREDARQKLGIERNETVMLVFGAVKENEKDLINKAFKFIPGKRKVLIAPGWKINRRKISYIRLREWVWKIEKFFASKRRTKRFNYGFVDEGDAQYFLNSADFLFIPRTNELNSGNITLGCTFGLVVVGKNGGDIGEILTETGNPTFEVGNNASLKEAINKAITLKEINHGQNNKLIAISEWSAPNIAFQYFNMYRNSSSL